MVLKNFNEGISANVLLWSPRGQICLLAGINRPQPEVSFNG
jgi:hypothetical protein